MVRACKSDISALFELQDDNTWLKIDDYSKGMCYGIMDVVHAESGSYELVELCKECAIRVGLEW